MPDLRLDREAAADMLGIDTTSIVAVQLLRQENHTWRATSADSTFYVKAHTKDWYDAAPAGSVPVRHEVTGYQTLRTAGLPAPDVVAHSNSCHNPLGWPYIITRGLVGTPMADLLSTADTTLARRAVHATGAYLAAMHSLTFDHPGYLIDGPPEPPDQQQWLHWLSRLERFLLYFCENVTAHKHEIDLATHDAVFDLLQRTLPRLRQAYQPLRFVHGDCHANVFFIDHATAAVSGVIDMENCSAGAPEFDFVKLFIELAGHLGAADEWWAQLFAGYGDEPDFDLIRLLMIGHAHINYTCLGEHAWPGTRADVLRHIVAARDWNQLFDITRPPLSANRRGRTGAVTEQSASDP